MCVNLFLISSLPHSQTAWSHPVLKCFKHPSPKRSSKLGARYWDFALRVHQINACSKSLPGGGAGPRPQAFVPPNVETMATPLGQLLLRKRLFSQLRKHHQTWHWSRINPTANLDVNGTDTPVSTGHDSCDTTRWPRGTRHLWIKDQNNLPYFQFLDFSPPFSSGS